MSMSTSTPMRTGSNGSPWVASPRTVAGPQGAQDGGGALRLDLDRVGHELEELAGDEARHRPQDHQEPRRPGGVDDHAVELADQPAHRRGVVRRAQLLLDRAEPV